MAFQSFVLGVTVYDTDGSTPKSNITVKLRNENNNNEQTGVTDSSGKKIFNLGNFTNGWGVNDIISYYVLSSSYEASGSFTATNIGGTTVTLTLVSLPTAASLRYFTVQEFLDTFELVTYDSDNSNGIKPQTIVKIGQSIESEMDLILNRKYDSNSGSYYSHTNEYHYAGYNQRLFNLDNTPVISLTKFEVNTAEEDSEEVWKNLVYTLLDACDATTSWSAGTDGAITLNSTNDQFQEGSACLNITKTGATVDNVLFSKTISNSYSFTGRTFKLGFYCEDITELASSGTAVQIQVGSDSSNYYYMNFARSSIGGSAWTTLSLSHDSSDSNAGTTGSPDPEACDYVAVKVTYAASTTTVTAGDMRLDNIRFNNSEDLNTDLETGRVELSDGVDDLPASGYDQVRASYTQGSTSVPYDVKRLAILMTGKAFAAQALARLNIDVTEASGLNSAIQNLTNYDNEINQIISLRKLPIIRAI